MSSKAPTRSPVVAGRFGRTGWPLPAWIEWLARQWRRARMLYRVLLLVRFSLLLGIVGALVMLLNDQAQDVLRALGEDLGWPTFWFVLAAVLGAAVAWWSARVMFYFRFRNPASSPHVFPWIKEQLPRALGASVLVLTALALFLVSFSYDRWITGPAGRLRLLALILLLLTLAFVYATIKRRVWFARLAGGARPSDLRALRELHWQAWLPLVLAAALGFGLMLWFAYRAVEVAPHFGTATIALLATVGLIPVGSSLVYLGNRASLPIVSLTLIWAAGCTWLIDNHLVRLHKDMPSYALPASRTLPPEESQPDLAANFAGWVQGLEPAADGSIPVFIVAAEGGGIRAAYWTALVLGELQDRALSEDRDFARHVFAISGVSGGSLGAATFAALIANDRLGPTMQAAGCPVDEGVNAGTVRGRAEGVLRPDFLAPTVAVMLFPDLFQQLVPFGFLNDRAVALERSWEVAWRACEMGRWFDQPFVALWSEPAVHVPLLFLNSTVVETGQRLIAAPVRIEEPWFSEALDSQRALGPEVPLSTAVHNSARFTYVSPAGTVRRADAANQWIRLVDGGYFENSGAVTAAELLRSVELVAAELGTPIRPVVIHISNDPETTAPDDLAERRKLLNQVVAPIKALLNVRPARGFQAREDLAKRVGAHVHFRLCRNPDLSRPGRETRPLPLGWALSSLARQEMRRQLGVLADGEDDPIVLRNRASLERVQALLDGAPFQANSQDIWECPQAGGVAP